MDRLWMEVRKQTAARTAAWPTASWSTMPAKAFARPRKPRYCAGVQAPAPSLRSAWTDGPRRLQYLRRATVQEP